MTQFYSAYLDQEDWSQEEEQLVTAGESLVDDIFRFFFKAIPGDCSLSLKRKLGLEGRKIFSTNERLVADAFKFLRELRENNYLFPVTKGKQGVFRMNPIRKSFEVINELGEFSDLHLLVDLIENSTKELKWKIKGQDRDWTYYGPVDEDFMEVTGSRAPYVRAWAARVLVNIVKRLYSQQMASTAALLATEENKHIREYVEAFDPDFIRINCL